MNKVKTKDCVICGNEFIMYKTTDKCCSYLCQSDYNSRKKGSKTTKSVVSEVYVGINDKVVKYEKELYSIIWNERPHKSYLSKRPLNFEEGSSFYFSCFAHILAKGKAKYPRFKLYSANIVLLHPEEHTLLDQGSEAQRQKYALKYGCNWSKIYALRDELKAKYKTLFPTF